MKGFIRKSLAVVCMTAAAGVAAMASEVKADPAAGIKYETFAMKRTGDNMFIDLTLNLKDLKVPSNRAKLIEPRLVNGRDSLTLRPLGLYGHRRYYYYQRNSDDGTMIAGEDERVYLRSKAPDTVAYHLMLPYSEWMNGSQMIVQTSLYGCCNNIEAVALDTLGIYRYLTFKPQWIFVRPKDMGDKIFDITGRAFIDFPVDQTVIYPDYRRNVNELAKIQATIDSVRDDKDVTIKKVWLKGFASPESPYKHNTDLSIGRVHALKNHIQNLYHFAPGIIETDNEPEDWEGLARFVKESNLEHRDQILAIINSDMAPDPKEARIKNLYPAEYKFMLTQYYPALRHTDYRIEYQVRKYTDINELREVFATNPSKLSLEELFTLANSYPVGSPEFNNVFDTAVRMYPDNETANLNAATSAMENGELKLAAKFLAKAGDTPQALYCRGVLAALNEDYDNAGHWLKLAAEAGVTQADDALRQIQLLKEQNNYIQ